MADGSLRASRYCFEEYTINAVIKVIDSQIKYTHTHTHIYATKYIGAMQTEIKWPFQFT